MFDFYNISSRALTLFPAETGHRFALKALANGLGPRGNANKPKGLNQTLWQRTFLNPLAISAGFDKNGAAISGVLKLGVGFIEVGGVTPRPQKGNPKPRLFRLEKDEAAINRLGFNNLGADQLLSNIRQHNLIYTNSSPIGVNLAANSDSTDPSNDFEKLVDKFASQVDFLTVDISCPNSKNGLVFLSPKPLQDLLDKLIEIRDRKDLKSPPALLVKLSPDIEYRELDILVEVIVNAGIDGITISNTTIKRPKDLTSPNQNEVGGLSGKPLFLMSTEMLRYVFKITGGNIPLVGVGGVSSGADAYEKICAGASLVQVYTALVYKGPKLIFQIKNDLAKLLEANGFSSIKDAIGSKN